MQYLGNRSVGSRHFEVSKKVFGATLITRITSYRGSKPVQKSKKIFFEILSGMKEDVKIWPYTKFQVNRTTDSVVSQNRKPA